MDVYEPCPCGSGKKLKFCCSAVMDDMEKINRNIDNNQLRMAEQALESLRKEHPAAAWVPVTEARVYFLQERFDEAKVLLRTLLQTQPEHAMAMLLLTMGILGTEGFDAAKKGIYWSLQKAVKEFPQFVADLISTAAEAQASANRHFSARELLALAMPIAPEEDQRDAFVRLLEFDSQQEIPYLLRGVHAIPEWTPDEESTKEYRRAMRLASAGLHEPATELFVKLAESHPDIAELRHAAALCAGWDGNETRAAELFRAAAELYDDWGQAVECEAIGQIFAAETSENKVSRVGRMCKIQGLSKFITQLGLQPKIVRAPEMEASVETIVAAFLYLDRPIPAEDADELPEPDDVPQILAEISIFDPGPDADVPPSVMVIAKDGPALEAVFDVFRTAVPEFATDESEDLSNVVPDTVVGDMLTFRFWTAPTVSFQYRQSLELAATKKAWQEIWPQTRLEELGGRTPQEVAADPEGKLQATAAAYVLDAYAQRQGLIVDVEKVLEQLGLEPLPAIDFPADKSPALLTSMQLHRLSCEDLSDEQLNVCVNREMVIRHTRHLYRFLKAALERPACRARLDLSRAYKWLIRLERMRGNHQAALEWIEPARQHELDGASVDERFLVGVQWDFQELSIRLDEPSDPKVRELLVRFRSQYMPKVPQVRGMVETVLESAGRMELLAILDESGMTTEGGLWTPESAAATGEEKKLWLPGGN